MQYYMNREVWCNMIMLQSKILNDSKKVHCIGHLSVNK